MEKVAVFGGSFDPVHKAHARMAELALESFNLKKVIFVPAYAAPHKTKQYAGINERIAMLKLALRDIKKAEISFYEAEKKDKVYSYETLDYFQALYPQGRILMIIGSDSLLELPTWKSIDYIAEKYGFIVAKRPGANIDANTKYAQNCLFMEPAMPDISSTFIRELVRKNDKTAAEFLDGKVFDYIKENGLYK